MAAKKSPASQARKKLREKRERASALAAQSSVKADKKQAWWCQKKRAPAYNDLPSSQRKKQKRAEGAVDRPENWFTATAIGALVSFCLYVYYLQRLHRWFLVGPDTLYLSYGLSSHIVAGLVFLMDICVLNAALNAVFSAVRDWSRSGRGLRSVWKELKGPVLFVILGMTLLHSLILFSCLSRTEATAAGVSTYILGIQTSWHSFENLEEADFYISWDTTRSGHRTRQLRNYELKFQDGYEVKLTDLGSNCIGRKQLNQLHDLVSPAFQN